MHFVHKISAFPCLGLSVKSFPVIALLFFLPSHKMAAQVMDDFSDGNFTAAPSWFGSSGEFIVNASGQLQLNATVAGKSWLSTAFAVMPNQSTVWEFYVKQSFAPSGANFGRFYLMSDQTDLSGPLNGYFLQFGEAGSGDAIELFRQTGTALTPVCRATAGAIASSFAVRVRVMRENNGDWQLLIAYDATNNFVTDASGSDAVHQQGQYTGLLCTYTITNATRFYYDDFYFSTTEVGDSYSPQVLSLEVLTSRTLQITFSEDMDSTSVSDPLAFVVEELSLHPEIIERQSDARIVVLKFPSDFRNGYTHTLEIQGATDLAGNVIADTAVAFLFFQPYPIRFKDIIINEILPDPSPTVGLPEAEYVEVYNRGSEPVDLSGWTLSDETSAARLEHFILLPGRHLVLTNAAEKFDVSGDAMDVPLPSLNNSADLIKLRDPEGLVVDSLGYSASWYTDDTRDGGWSLELIDPENICAGTRNWTISESVSGGTPGTENSVRASLPDNIGPLVVTVAPSDSLTLIIAFDEPLDKELPPADHFEIEPMRDIMSVHFNDPSLSSIALGLGNPLQPGEFYNITVRDVYDCSGNPLQTGMISLQFIIPEKAGPSDIVINEILFNPMPQGVDFVEVFNRSDKVIDLNHWSLANPLKDDEDKAVTLSERLNIMKPGEYRVFTEDADVLKGEYIAGNESAFRETDLPPLNDDEGLVIIRDHLGRMIDSVSYSDDYHNPFVRDGEGISLERISPSSPGIEVSNWRSASSQSGYATPGYLNSNVRAEALSDDLVSVEPEVIRPGNSPLSFALIRYHLAHGGVMANVRVVDQQGRSIRQIASNELLGSEGFFRWDADLDDGSPAAVGYYMVWFEIFDAEGMVQVVRKRLAIF